MNPSIARRHELIARYVDLVHHIGSTPTEGRSLRDSLQVGGIDYWAASPLRESSPWLSPVFKRLDAIRGVEDEVVVDIPRRQYSGVVSQVRLKVRILGYWFLTMLSSLRNRPLALNGEVLFIVFMPEVAEVVSDEEILERYFGGLPKHVRDMGLTPVVLFLPTNSRPGSMSSGERRTWNRMSRESGSQPILSYLGPRQVWQSWRVWRRMRQSVPRTSTLMSCMDRRIASMWPLFADDYLKSVGGTASIRISLLAMGFRNALNRLQGIRIVVYPFEGQGWESIVESACREQALPSVGYLHTIMKPWDLRAHTAMCEAPPRVLALHGDHDRSELVGVAGPRADLWRLTLESVEALQYNYLADTRAPQLKNQRRPQVLIVFGSDCENSQVQFQQFVEEVGHQSKLWSLLVKTHPQCAQISGLNRSIPIVTGNLRDALRESSAVFLCGTAAPLDSYLYGLPTAAIADASGYSMSPVEADANYFVGHTPSEVVNWLDQALQRPISIPLSEHYFDLSQGYAKWEAAIRKLMSNHAR